MVSDDQKRIVNSESKVHEKITLVLRVTESGKALRLGQQEKWAHFSRESIRREAGFDFYCTKIDNTNSNADTVG